MERIAVELGLCRTHTVLDYRHVVFGDFGFEYALVESRDGRVALAKIIKGDCVGVSRELAFHLYPYYGWGVLDIKAHFALTPTSPEPARRLLIRVPFGISEQVIRRQLTGYPLVEGAVALEYLEHVEYGEIVHVEPKPSVLADGTVIKIFEFPVEDDAVVFMRR